MNEEFKIQGTYTRTKDYSVFALTQIEYIGDNKQLQNIQISNYNYELFNNNRRIYNHNLSKIINYNSDMTLKETFLNTNILIDSTNDYMHSHDNLNDLILILSYFNEIDQKYEIKVPIKLIEQSNNKKIW